MVKNPPASEGDLGSIPGMARSPEEGNDNPTLYSCRQIAWTEGAGELQSMGGKESDMV